MKKNLQKLILFIVVVGLSFVAVKLVTNIIDNEVNAERMQGIIETAIQNGDQFNIDEIDPGYYKTIKKSNLRLSDTTSKMTIEFFDGSGIEIYYDNEGYINFCEIIK